MSVPRPRAPLVRRLVPIAIALAAAGLFAEFVMPKPVDLYLRIPEGAAEFQRIDVRVVRDDDGAQVLRAQRAHEPGARSIVVSTKLKGGRYRVEAWPSTNPAPRWEGLAEVEGDAADVVLRVAP